MKNDVLRRVTDEERERERGKSFILLNRVLDTHSDGEKAGKESSHLLKEESLKKSHLQSWQLKRVSQDTLTEQSKYFSNQNCYCCESLFHSLDHLLLDSRSPKWRQEKVSHLSLQKSSRREEDAEGNRETLQETFSSSFSS